MKKTKKYYKKVLETLKDFTDGQFDLTSGDTYLDLSKFKEDSFYENFWMIISSTPWPIKRPKNLSIFLLRYEDDLDWFWVCKVQNLSIKDIEKYIEHIYFGQISNHQRLTKDFIQEYSDQLDWEYLIANQPEVDKEMIENNLDKYIKPFSILTCQQLEFDDKLEFVERIRDNYKKEIDEFLSQDYNCDDLIKFDAKLGKIDIDVNKFGSGFTVPSLFQFGRFTDEQLDDILNLFEDSSKISIKAVGNLCLYQDPGLDLMVEYHDLLDRDMIKQNPFMSDAKKEEILKSIRLQSLGLSF